MITNPLKGEQLLTLDKDYKCRLTIDSLIKIEEELGKGIIKATTDIANANVLLKDLVIVLKYALRGGGNDLQDKDIKTIISNVGLIKASTVVATLLAKSLSDPEEESKNEGVKKSLEET